MSSTFARRLVLPLAAAALSACTRTGTGSLSPAQRAAIADTVKRTLTAACDLSRPNVEQRLLSLYPDSGPVISAAAGRVTTTRTALEGSIHTFWDNVGRNMRNPKWVWGEMNVTVLAPNAAVVTSTYRIPHLTPMNMPHIVGGAWTAVFQRQHGRWLIVQEHLSDAPNP